MILFVKTIKVLVIFKIKPTSFSETKIFFQTLEPRSSEKRDWCCGNFQKGCAATTLSPEGCAASCEVHGEHSTCQESKGGGWPGLLHPFKGGFVGENGAQ